LQPPIFSTFGSMEADLLAGSGAAMLAISAYLHICNQARRRWLCRIIETPETSVDLHDRDGRLRRRACGRVLMRCWTAPG